MCSGKVKVDYISDRDIDRSHRVGRPRDDNKPRAIILKFLRHTDKETVIRVRRKLKGTGIVTREDLTKTRMGWISSLRDHVEHFKIWSNDGTVVVLVNDNRHYIRNPNDLEVVLAILRH